LDGVAVELGKDMATDDEDENGGKWDERDQTIKPRAER
jgi:hypothetical protein